MRLVKQFFREFSTKGDLLLLGFCNLASLFGLMLIYTATNYWEDNSKTMMVQGSAIIIGNVAYVLLTVVDFRSIMEKCWKYVFGFNVVIMVILKYFGSDNDSGNHNWIEIPFMGVDIQPNEITKITFILLIAYHMSRIHQEKRSINHPVSLTILGFHVLFPIALIAYICGDWGMCVIYLCIAITMLWCGGVASYLFGIAFALVGTAVHIMWVYFLPFTDLWENDYRILRFRNILDHSVDATGVGWQPTRSLLAIGSGKLFGQGYLQGIHTQSASIWSLPARHTDFIFTVCGEELGFVGCVLLLTILFSIVLRCVWISRQVDSYFSAYVAMGAAGMLLAQIIFNVGMCLYILPTMGLTLPFCSYGGSSIVTMFASMGVVSSLRSRNLPSWIRDRSQFGA